RAAFLAIAFRFAGLSDAARILPPLDAPSLLKATAAGLRVSGSGSGSGEPSRRSPMACSTTRRATETKSRSPVFFGLLAREGTANRRMTAGRFQRRPFSNGPTTAAPLRLSKRGVRESRVPGPLDRLAESNRTSSEIEPVVASGRERERRITCRKR